MVRDSLASFTRLTWISTLKESPPHGNIHDGLSDMPGSSRGRAHSSLHKDSQPPVGWASFLMFSYQGSAPRGKRKTHQCPLKSKLWNSGYHSGETRKSWGFNIYDGGYR